jgi:hypothetical protein
MLNKKIITGNTVVASILYLSLSDGERFCLTTNSDNRHERSEKERGGIMKKHAVIVHSVLWGILAMTSLPSSVFAQGMGGTTPAAPSGKMPMPAKSAPVTTSMAAPNMASGIHANKKSHVYHLSNCPGYAKVNEKNLMSFATEDEAVKAGFHKAKNCPK